MAKHIYITLVGKQHGVVNEHQELIELEVEGEERYFPRLDYALCRIVLKFPLVYRMRLKNPCCLSSSKSACNASGSL